MGATSHKVHAVEFFEAIKIMIQACQGKDMKEPACTATRQGMKKINYSNPDPNYRIVDVQKKRVVARRESFNLFVTFVDDFPI
jgi:hypothetical protein